MKKILTFILLFTTFISFGQWDQRKIRVEYNAVHALDSIVFDSIITSNAANTFNPVPVDTANDKYWVMNFITKHTWCQGKTPTYQPIRFDRGSARLNFPAMYTLVAKKSDNSYVRVPLRGNYKTVVPYEESRIDTNCLFYGYSTNQGPVVDMIAFADSAFLADNEIEDGDTVWLANAYYQYDEGATIDNVAFGDNVDFTNTSVADGLKQLRGFLLHYINNGSGDSGVLQYSRSIWTYPLNIGPYAGDSYTGNSQGAINIGVRANQGSNNGSREGVFIGTLGAIGYGRITDSSLDSADFPSYSLPFGPNRLGENVAIGHRLTLSAMSGSVAIGARLGDPAVLLGAGSTFMDGSVVIGNYAAQAYNGVDAKIYNSIGLGTKVFEAVDLIQDVIGIGADQYAEVTGMSAVHSIQIGNQWNINEPDSVYGNISLGHGVVPASYTIVIGHDLTAGDSATITLPTGYEIKGATIGASQFVDFYYTNADSDDDVTTYLQAGSDPTSPFNEYNGFAAIVQDNDSSNFKHDLWMDETGLGVSVESKTTNKISTLALDTANFDFSFSSNTGVLKYAGNYDSRISAEANGRAIPDIAWLSSRRNLSDYQMGATGTAYYIDVVNTYPAPGTDAFTYQAGAIDNPASTQNVWEEEMTVGYDGQHLYYTKTIRAAYVREHFYWNNSANEARITYQEDGDVEYYGTGSFVYAADYTLAFDASARAIPDVGWIRNEISDSLTALTPSIQTVTATSDTVEVTANTVLVDDDTAGGAVTLYFYAASAYPAGKAITIIKTGSTANVTLDANGAEVFNASTTFALTTQWEQSVVLSDATQWYRR